MNTVRTHIRHLLEGGQVMGVKLEGQVWLVQQDSLLRYMGTMQALGRAKHNPVRPELLAQGRGRHKRPGRKPKARSTPEALTEG